MSALESQEDVQFVVPEGSLVPDRRGFGTQFHSDWSRNLLLSSSSSAIFTQHPRVNSTTPRRFVQSGSPRAWGDSGATSLSVIERFDPTDPLGVNGIAWRGTYSGVGDGAQLVLLVGGRFGNETSGPEVARRQVLFNSSANHYSMRRNCDRRTTEELNYGRGNSEPYQKLLVSTPRPESNHVMANGEDQGPAGFDGRRSPVGVMQMTRNLVDRFGIRLGVDGRVQFIQDGEVFFVSDVAPVFPMHFQVEFSDDGCLDLDHVNGPFDQWGGNEVPR